jgi:CYTH domain-containing protein
MTEHSPSDPVTPIREGKYARIERERRFLLCDPPHVSAVVAAYRITDRYLTGTRLRLRHMRHIDTGNAQYKLTQKIPAATAGPIQGLITNTYLSPAEYHALAGLPAAVLSKTRLSVPPVGIDIFHGTLTGLIMAEAEFTSDSAAAAFTAPPYCAAEVTDDSRFTGGSLVHADRNELASWLTEYRITLGPDPTQPT